MNICKNRVAPTKMVTASKQSKGVIDMLPILRLFYDVICRVIVKFCVNLFRFCFEFVYNSRIFAQPTTDMVSEPNRSIFVLCKLKTENLTILSIIIIKWNYLTKSAMQRLHIANGLDFLSIDQWHRHNHILCVLCISTMVSKILTDGNKINFLSSFKIIISLFDLNKFFFFCIFFISFFQYNKLNFLRKCFSPILA